MVVPGGGAVSYERGSPVAIRGTQEGLCTFGTWKGLSLKWPGGKYDPQEVLGRS